MARKKAGGEEKSKNRYLKEKGKIYPQRILYTVSVVAVICNFILFCFVLSCFVLFCFVLYCFVCFVLFCIVLFLFFCFVFYYAYVSLSLLFRNIQTRTLSLNKQLNNFVTVKKGRSGRREN